MIFITGASGNVGTAVVQALQTRQVPLRIGSRKPDAVMAQDQIEVVPFDFLDAATFSTAVRGCQAVFLLRPPAISNTRETLNVLIDVARTEGIQSIVFVSVAGAADRPWVPHHAVEQCLQQGSSGWTILRPGFFAQNFGDAYREDIVQLDRVIVPAGKGRVAFIDARDIAQVAAKILLDPAPHHAKIYTLTGSEALSFAAAAQMLSEVLERTIAYDAASIPGYGWHLLRRKLPLAQILVQTVLHVGLRFGQAESVDPALAQLLEHPPRTLQDYFQDHRELWLRSSLKSI
ncbi:MAG: NAD(P)H-binding protein [Leptolyngbyaceae cyanobacterium bins.302]|nr:NAD(P)H-binding protein [Leptolyngbyaceae cyanobacterium bins.302]